MFRLVGGDGAVGWGRVGRPDPSRRQLLPLGCGGDTKKDLKLLVVEVMVVVTLAIVVIMVCIMEQADGCLCCRSCGIHCYITFFRLIIDVLPW